VVIVGVAVFLGVHFLAGSGSDQVVSHPTVTTSPAPGGQAVTTEQALQQIVDLARATIRRGQQISGLGPDPSLLDEAIVLSVIRTSERSGIQLQQPATRAQFCLWLWRCFGPVLPSGSTTVRISDASLLTPDEQQAVEGLIRDGVVELPVNGAFGGDRVLTVAAESAVLTRVESLVGHPASS